MKKIIVFLMLSLGMNVYSQLNQTLVLKNGSELKGKIMEEKEGKTRIMLKDGTIWSYDKKEIVSIETALPKVSRPGYFFRSNVGVMAGENASFLLHVVNGYSFNGHWDLGLGVGLENYNGDWYIPMSVQGRFNLLKKPTTPFADVLVGYEMPFSRWYDNRKGLTAGISIGMTQSLGRHVSMSTSIGYRFAYLERNSSWWQDFTTIREINRVEVKVGINIK